MSSAKKYHEGTFIALGMLIFIPVGIALSVATDAPGLIGIGPAIGLPIGLAWEEHYKKKGLIRKTSSSPATGKLKWWTIVLGVVFLLGILGLLIFF